MMQRGRHAFLLLAVGALALAGCMTARHTPPVAPPLAFADAKLARGQQVFYQQCHLCHPHGGTGLGPAISNKPLPGFLMKMQVRLGLGAMPSFKEDKIPAEDLDALIAYLKILHANKPRAGAVTG